MQFTIFVYLCNFIVTKQNVLMRFCVVHFISIVVEFSFLWRVHYSYKLLM